MSIPIPFTVTNQTCVRIWSCLNVPAYVATHRNETSPRAIPTAYIREPAGSSHTVCRLPLKALVRRLQEVKVKVKCTLVQALRLCTDRTAHTGSRDVAPTFHDHGTRRGWGVSVTPRPLYRERPGTTLYRRLNGPLGRSGWVWKIWPPPGFDPRTVQPVASRCTDSVIPTLCKRYRWLKTIHTGV